MDGWIKIHRQLEEWEWYKNIPVKTLFIHCLIKANHKDKKWQGKIIKRGSFITSYETLAIETGLSIQQVRTALNKLKTTNELTHESTSQHSIITIKNYELYQAINTQDNNQITNEQQTDNNQITTTKNDKNIENIKKDIKNIPTKTEIENFCKIVAKKINVDDFINWYNASNWEDVNGMPVNWQQKVLSWSRKTLQSETKKEVDGWSL